MPVIEVDHKDLCSLLGVEMCVEELVDKIPMLGADVEGYEDGKIRVELFPDRPDLYSTAGLARALRSFFEIEVGLKEYRLEDSGSKLRVDKSVRGIRDYVVACEVHGVVLNNSLIQELMEMQEDLHWAVGRDRRKVAIGVHDKSGINGPYLYTTVKPEEIEFVPLDMNEALTPKEILERHPKGITYAHILKRFDRYPIILDSDNKVLSMPPIINGELTRVTENTTEFFIEMTGTDLLLLNHALNILATSFAERGWAMKRVEVRYPNKTVTTPDLTPGEKTIERGYVNKMLGLNLETKEIASYLQKMGFGAKINRDKLEVSIPAYRLDVLHKIDLVEDVAIGYGYERFEPSLPEMTTVGEKDALEKFCEKARYAMLGYGFTEVMTLILSNPENNFHKMRTEGNAVEIKNPITEEHTILRTSLLPGLLDVLEINKHRQLPQRIFEIGDVILPDPSAETGARNIRMLSACYIDSNANFTYIKSIVEGILRDLSIGKWGVEKFESGSFIRGRCAGILVNKKRICNLGELHPEVITNFGLEYPVAGFELDLGRIEKLGRD